jgi:hypothetical protein
MLSRRQFLQGTAIAAVSAAVPSAPAGPVYVTGFDVARTGGDMTGIAVVRLYPYQVEMLRWIERTEDNHLMINKRQRSKLVGNS